MYTKELRFLALQKEDAETPLQQSAQHDEEQIEQQFFELFQKSEAQGIEFARKSLEKFPKNKILLLFLARHDLEIGQFMTAEYYASTLHGLDTENSAVSILLIKIYLHTFQCLKAEKLIEKVLEKDPKDIEVWQLKGKKEFVMGDISSARLSVEHARKLDFQNKFPTLKLDLARIELAELQFGIARARIEDYLQYIDPDNLEAKLLKSQLFLYDSEFSQARFLCKGVLTASPKNTAALITMGQIALAESKLQEAEQMAETVLKLQSNHPLAHLLKKQVDVFKYIDSPHINGVNEDEIKKLIEMYPKNMVFKNTLGLIHLIKNNTKEAGMIFREVLTQNKKDTFALSSLAEILLQEGDISKAEEMAYNANLIDWKSLHSLYVSVKIALSKNPPDFDLAMISFQKIALSYPQNMQISSLYTHIQYLAHNSHQSPTPEFQRKLTEVKMQLQVQNFFRAPEQIAIF